MLSRESYIANAIQKNIIVKINIGEMIFNIYVNDGFFQTDARPELLQFNHRHNHSSFELQLIFHGRGVMKIEGQNIEFDGKCAFLIFPGVYHVLEFTSETKIKKDVFHSAVSYQNKTALFNDAGNESIQALLTNDSIKFYHHLIFLIQLKAVWKRQIVSLWNIGCSTMQVSSLSFRVF